MANGCCWMPSTIDSHVFDKTVRIYWRDSLFIFHVNMNTGLCRLAYSEWKLHIMFDLWWPSDSYILHRYYASLSTQAIRKNFFPMPNYSYSHRSCLVNFKYKPLLEMCITCVLPARLFLPVAYTVINYTQSWNCVLWDRVEIWKGHMC